MARGSSPHGAIVEKALEFAKKAHSGQERRSGEPYITHLIAVCDMLKEVNADEETLAAALLHDTIEDTGTTYATIEQEFGETVAKLVEGVTKVQRLEGKIDKEEQSMRSIRKIFRTMGKDIRVIFIKLADRMHNMRTLEFMPLHKQQRIARETLDIYCPLADLLGIDMWFRELSDLCFKTLNKPGYELINRKAQSTWNAQHTTLEKWMESLKISMKEEGWDNADFQIVCRNFEEVFMKTQGNESDLGELETFCTIRIVIPDDEDCYACMGKLHQLVTLLPGQIRDYIAEPKLNGYRALHSIVVTPTGSSISLTFQTQEMYNQSHLGALTMFRRGQGKKSVPAAPEWITALVLLEEEEEDTGVFFNMLHAEIFGERMRIYTGTREKHIEMPAGSTVLDAAFYLDEKTGLHAISGIVNNQEVNLKTILSEGDSVKFQLDSKHIPRDASDLRFLRTSFARKYLIGHLSQLTHEQQEAKGASLLEHAIDITMDPFFGIGWQKKIRSHILEVGKNLASIGTGIRNPFVYIEEHSSIEQFLLLDPRCFMMISRMSPSTGMHYVLRASLRELRSGNIIGLQSGPDIIDIISAEVLAKERRFSKEYVPIRTRPALLEFPFFFALRFNYDLQANPLGAISTLQNILDTPVNLLRFENGSVTLGFHTDRLYTVQTAYEYLSALPYISEIFRITPP